MEGFIFGVKAWIVAVLVGVGVVALGAVLYIASAQTDAAIQEIVRPTQINDFDTRMERSAQFNQRHQSLRAIRASLAGVEQQLTDLRVLYGEDTATWPLDKKQEYAQLLTTRQQYETTYNAACGAYQAAWDDEFKATAAPKDLPRTCDMI